MYWIFFIFISAADVLAGKAIPPSAEENQENISANVPSPTKPEKIVVNGSGDAPQQMIQ